MAVSAPIRWSPSFWLGLALLSGLGWVTVQSFWVARRSLAEVSVVTGRLQAAAIKYRSGKHGYHYLEFSLQAQPLVFGLRTSNFAEPTAEVLRKLRTSPQITVYYEPPLFFPSDTNFDLYQLDTTQGVIYPHSEARHRLLANATWWLLITFAALISILGWRLN